MDKRPDYMTMIHRHYNKLDIDLSSLNTPNLNYIHRKQLFSNFLCNHHIIHQIIHMYKIHIYVNHNTYFSFFFGVTSDYVIVEKIAHTVHITTQKSGIF